MTKVLKEMMCALYKKLPDVLREITLVGFLLFCTKFTMVLCDSPANYVCRINHTKTINLAEEADDICNEFLSMLKAVYQARLMMENTNRLIKQKPANIDDDIEYFTSEGSKRKSRRSDYLSEE
ncbi:uncharacterized protein BX663DRAFT_538445 [Cokeromyces recurvatus]|uniref:uncharacterized protein n=1 Tax=Cokeromyces recurvatus TaxID=90255 RepID=UPI00221FDAC2|nr:uncharacterized protein BX663DRAFT_538445 [Cokeromyces recurvatus]KAI7898516.1 hypothetical protein BX663DRAFT_538445 [Cokeromyces recurvatus]